MTPLDRMLDRQAIADLLTEHARAVDRTDAERVAATLHPDAEVVTGVFDATGRAFADGIVALVRANLRSCFHSLSNIRVEIAGDHAAGETSVIAHQLTLGDQPVQIVSGGRYLDRFERRDGRWAIASRRYIQDWAMTQPYAPDPAGADAPARGEDPAAGFWTAWAGGARA